jgi:RND family efflux transporter MFP subunit
MGLCLLALVGYVAYNQLARAERASSGGGPLGSEPKAAPEPASSRSTVSLPLAKLAEAKITTELARIDHLAMGVPVFGVIRANSDRQLEVRPRAQGVVREVHARLGQHVNRGDTLITLDSPEVGTARLNLRAKQRELTTARFEANWKSEIAANVAALIPELRKGITARRRAVADDEEHIDDPSRRPNVLTEAPQIKATDARLIEKQFADKQLGAYRGTLLQAYAEFDIASHEEQKQASLRSQNIVGEHPALVARHTREGIQAKLEAAIQQIDFDAAQEKRLADQQLGRAEAAVIDAAQRLRILGVPENIQDLLDHADQASSVARDEDVTFYKIAAAFDGTIIKKDVVFSQRVDLTDVLFILADLRSVWVNANVSEADIAKLPRIKNATFRMTATAYPDRELTAQLLSVGALVDPQTRTVPLLAQTENPDDLLKLGMFVRIMLDSSTTQDALTVPRAAVVEIESEKYVFVPSKEQKPEHQSFTLKPVEVGRSSGDRLEIMVGLTQGDRVVSSGAFLLKSELILHNQVDEE